MAILKSNPLGIISGRVGDLVFRTVHGTTYVSKRPDSNPRKLSDAEINSRKAFANNISFAKILYSYPELRSIWSNIYKSPWNKIIALNKKHITPEHPLPSARITPPGGFSVYLVYDRSSKNSFTFHFFQPPYAVPVNAPPFQVVSMNTWIEPISPSTSGRVGVGSSSFSFLSYPSVRSFPADFIFNSKPVTVEDNVSPVFLPSCYARKLTYFCILVPLGGALFPLFSETSCIEA